MESKAPPAFLSLLRAKGFPSLSALSKEIGDAGALAKLFARKERSMRSQSLAKLAAALGVSLDEAARQMGLDGMADVDGAGGFAAGLPVLHRVEAGIFQEEDPGDHDLAHRAVLPFGIDPRFEGAQWLEEVYGDSCDRFAPAGAFVHVLAETDPGRIASGTPVVVTRTRDGGLTNERTVKVLRRKGDRIELWPESTNPRWSAPLDLHGADDGVQLRLVGIVIWVHRPMGARRDR